METKIVHPVLPSRGCGSSSPGSVSLRASSQGSVAHLFLELLEGACNLHIGLHRGSPVLSSESE